jgi:amidase
VSLKDCFKVEATDAAIGYTAFVNQPTQQGEESEITNIMRQSGAILFCKTSVPLALMAGEASRVKDIMPYHTSNNLVDV